MSFIFFGKLQLIDSFGTDRYAYLVSLNLILNAYFDAEGWFSEYSKCLSNLLTKPSLNLDRVYALQSAVCFVLLIVFPAYLARTEFETVPRQFHPVRSSVQ